MLPSLYNYQLQLDELGPGRITNYHNYQTLPEAMHMLLTYGMDLVDHVRLAEGPVTQTVAAIYEKGSDDPLIRLDAIPFPRVEGSSGNSGLQIVNPTGTIQDLEEMTGLELFRFEAYRSLRNYLWIADYQKADGVAVSLDRELFVVQDHLAEQVGHGSDYRFTISEKYFTNPDEPTLHQSHNYYYENGLWALWALTQHQCLNDGDAKPFLADVVPAHLTIQGPGNQVLAESRLIAPIDRNGHLYAEHELVLMFTGGLPAYLAEHVPGINTHEGPQIGGESLLLADFSSDGNRLFPTPGFDELQYQLNRELSAQLAPPLGGYYIEGGYLPTRIPADQAESHPLHIERQYLDTFRQGLERMQALAPTIADRTRAVKDMKENYLVQAVMYEDGHELARMFRSHAGGDLPAGLYLKVNPDQVTLNALSKLGPFLTDVRQTMAFHFLLTQPGSESPPGRKHGGQARTVVPPSGSQRGI